MTRRWLKVDESDEGWRTVEEQMQGLERLAARVRGASILDVGCAEGFLGAHLLDLGVASTVTGVDRRHDLLAHGRKAASKGDALHLLEMDLEVLDRNDVRLMQINKPTVVLMLAVLQKLRDPERLIFEMSKIETVDLMIIRTPASLFKLKRGGGYHSVPEMVAKHGFELECTAGGPRGSWTGYFRRENAELF